MARALVNPKTWKALVGELHFAGNKFLAKALFSRLLSYHRHK